MSGEKLQAVVTDPPYGMSAVSSSGVLKERYGKDIAGDETPELARNVFRTLSGAKIPQIWWGANYYADATGGSSCWLVWDKNNGGSDQADAELAWTNLPGVVRIFKVASEKINRLHPTQKHPSLIRWCIEKCGAAQSIYEPFSGSGTTIIACEQLGRKCRAIEISPAYVAVAIQRWADATGKTPRLVP
jgi:site-specific DNA-methyltransferase (adenine-specific)